MEPKPTGLVCNIDVYQLEPDVAAPPEIPRPKRFLERLRRSQNVVIGGVLFFAALSTLALFVFGRRFLGVWAGVVGASLYLLNDLQLTYAQETRGYSLQLLLLCLAWYALFTAFTNETRTRRWWLCYVVTITLAFYTHLFSVLIFLAQLTTVAGLVLLPISWRVQISKRLIAFGSSQHDCGLL